jgi:hypothetical protein
LRNTDTLGQERQLKGFTADVLPENRKMRHVLEKMDWKIKVKRFGGVNRMTMDFLGQGLSALNVDNDYWWLTIGLKVFIGNLSAGTMSLFQPH